MNIIIPTIVGGLVGLILTLLNPGISFTEFLWLLILWTLIILVVFGETVFAFKPFKERLNDYKHNIFAVYGDTIYTRKTCYTLPKTFIPRMIHYYYIWRFENARDKSNSGTR